MKLLGPVLAGKVDSMAALICASFASTSQEQRDPIAAVCTFVYGYSQTRKTKKKFEKSRKRTNGITSVQKTIENTKIAHAINDNACEMTLSKRDRQQILAHVNACCSTKKPDPLAGCQNVSFLRMNGRTF